MTVAAHNRVLHAATRRAEKLEGRLVRILEPILRRAGDEAARGFTQHVTDHLTASALRAADADALERLAPEQRPSALPALALRAAAGNDGISAASTMVCVKPRPEEAQAIADPAGDPADRLHVTLVYLGQTDGPLERYAEPLRAVAATHGPLSGVVGGFGVFAPADVGILLPDVPGLVELRVAITEALVAAGIDYGRDHGFEAHITVLGEPGPDDATAALERAAGAPLHFDSILLVRGDAETVEVPLVGVLPLTAAAADEPPKWTAPAPTEVLDVESLVKSLRTKTDPVRMAVVKTVASPSLKKAGLSFDVTNPFIGKALASTGKHITSIAETTRADVMQVIRHSYDQGLSIPDTASAIRAAITDSATVRATMIARTELAGAVNGGSLAATQVVAGATGESYEKQWLTAPGAKYPRHEDYPDLDGQTVALDEDFEVGDSKMQHPGDPNGEPGEVINCRCTLVYVGAE